MIVDKPFASLKKAIGWKYKSYNGNWSDYSNSIFGIDEFNSFNLAFSNYGGKQFLCLFKIYRTGVYKYPNIKEGWESFDMQNMYIFSLEEYKEKISNLKTDNTLNFRLFYEHSTSKIAFDGKIGINDELINLYQQSEKFLVLKFRLNKEKKTARFLFYEEEKYSESFSSILGLQNVMSNDSDEGKIITSDALYENFYYEMPLDKFLEFIQAPLQK